MLLSLTVAVVARLRLDGDRVLSELDALLARRERRLERSIWPLEKYDSLDEPVPKVPSEGDFPPPKPDPGPPNEKNMRKLAVRDDEKWKWLFNDHVKAARAKAEKDQAKASSAEAPSDGKSEDGKEDGKAGGKSKDGDSDSVLPERKLDAAELAKMGGENPDVSGNLGRVDRVEQNVAAKMRKLVPPAQAQAVDEKSDSKKGGAKSGLAKVVDSAFNYGKTVALDLPRGHKTLRENDDLWVATFKAEDEEKAARRKEREEAERNEKARDVTTGPHWLPPFLTNANPSSGLGGFPGHRPNVPAERLALSANLALKGDVGKDKDGKPCHGLKGADPTQPFGDGAWMRNFPYAQPHPEGQLVVDSEGKPDEKNPLNKEMTDSGAKIAKGDAWGETGAKDPGKENQMYGCTKPADRRALCAEVVSRAPLPAFNKEGKPAGLATRLLERIKEDAEGKDGAPKPDTAGADKQPVDLTKCGHADVTDVVTALHAAQYAGWSCRLDATSKFVRVPKGHQMPVLFPGPMAGGAEACTPADCEAIGLDPLPLPKRPKQEVQQAQFESYSTGHYPAKPARKWSFRGKSYTPQGEQRGAANLAVVMARRKAAIGRMRPDTSVPGNQNPTHVREKKQGSTKGG